MIKANVRHGRAGGKGVVLANTPQNRRAVQIIKKVKRTVNYRGALVAKAKAKKGIPFGK